MTLPPGGSDDLVGAAVSSGRAQPGEWAQKVYALVAEIPRGKVTTYGEIGRQLGLSPRFVGGAMRSVPEGLAWWRVVGAGGGILTSRRLDGTGEEQSDRLRAEDVPFDENGRVLMERARYEI